MIHSVLNTCVELSWDFFFFKYIFHGTCSRPPPNSAVVLLYLHEECKAPTPEAHWLPLAEERFSLSEGSKGKL